jgi:hypothetical protein
VLESLTVLGREVHVSQAAEPCRHPVDDGSSLKCRHDDLARGVHPFHDLPAEAGGGTPRDLDHVFDAEWASEADRCRCCHGPSIAAGGIATPTRASSPVADLPVSARFGPRSA